MKTQQLRNSAVLTLSITAIALGFFAWQGSANSALKVKSSLDSQTQTVRLGNKEMPFSTKFSSHTNFPTQEIMEHPFAQAMERVRQQQIELGNYDESHAPIGTLVPLPEDLQAQLDAPPPELPDEVRNEMLSEPRPQTMPKSMRVAKHVKLPEDVRRQLYTPARVVSVDEVNNP